MSFYSNLYIKDVFIARNRVSQNPWDFDPRRPWTYNITVGPSKIPERYPLTLNGRISMDVITAEKFRRCRFCGAFIRQARPKKYALCESCDQASPYSCALGNLDIDEDTLTRCKNCIDWKTICSSRNIFYIAAYTENHKFKIGITTDARFSKRIIEGGYNAAIPFYKEGGGSFSKVEVIQIEREVAAASPAAFSSQGFPTRKGMNNVQGVFSERNIRNTLLGILEDGRILLRKLGNVVEKVKNICMNRLDIEVESHDGFVPNYNHLVNRGVVAKLREDPSQLLLNKDKLSKNPFQFGLAKKYKVRHIEGTIIAAKYPSLILDYDGEYYGILLRKQDYRGKLFYMKENNRLYGSWFKDG